MVTHYITFTEYLHIDVTASVLLWLLTFPAVRIPLTRHTKTITQHSNKHKANSHWIPPRLSRLSDTFKTLLLKSYNSNNQSFFCYLKMIFVCLWLWSYGSWIYNYLCNQCLSPLMLWVWISIRARCTTLCDKVCQWLATGQWFSPGPPIKLTVTIWMKYCWKWR